jgi:hypothetical protein
LKQLVKQGTLCEACEAMQAVLACSGRQVSPDVAVLLFMLHFIGCCISSGITAPPGVSWQELYCLQVVVHQLLLV